MRTTVTLDNDVEQLIRDAMQRSRMSFKAVLNQAVREGLSERAVPLHEEEPFRVKSQKLGLKTGIDPTRLNQKNDEIEAEAFLELSRRLIEEQRSQS